MVVKVKLRDGVYVRMDKAEAIKKGLYTEPPKQKMRPPALNKMVMPTVHKLDSIPEPDDLTEIPGIGKATAEALNQAGIKTFDQLMAADLSFLPGGAVKAVEKWRESL